MPVHVALLRGINLGSKRRVAMSDLREVLGELGYEDVRTHLQSGNAVFRTPVRFPCGKSIVDHAVTGQLCPGRRSVLARSCMINGGGGGRSGQGRPRAR
jgi:hypothetical protein